jgi:hypothetical protein
LRNELHGENDQSYAHHHEVKYVPGVLEIVLFHADKLNNGFNSKNERKSYVERVKNF